MVYLLFWKTYNLQLGWMVEQEALKVTMPSPFLSHVTNMASSPFLHVLKQPNLERW